MQTPSDYGSGLSTSSGGAAGSGSTTQQAVDQAKDKAGQVVDQAQQVAGQVTDQAKQQATSQLATQKDKAVESLVTVAQALRQTSQHLQSQQQGTIAGYLDQVAERAENATNYLRARDVPELMDDVQDLGRRNPGVFLGGALVLGFLGARFLMASGQRAAEQQRRERAASLPAGGAYPPAYGAARTAPYSTPSYGAPTPSYSAPPSNVASTPGYTSPSTTPTTYPTPTPPSYTTPTTPSNPSSTSPSSPAGGYSSLGGSTGV